MSYIDQSTKYTESEVREKMRDIIAYEGITRRRIALSIGIMTLTVRDFLEQRRPTKVRTFLKLHKFVVECEDNKEYLRSIRRSIKTDKRIFLEEK
jgi:hypothetical protein